jgi:hypothetical protein
MRQSDTNSLHMADPEQQPGRRFRHLGGTALTEDAESGVGKEPLPPCQLLCPPVGISVSCGTFPPPVPQHDARLGEQELDGQPELCQVAPGQNAPHGVHDGAAETSERHVRGSSFRAPPSKRSLSTLSSFDVVAGGANGQVPGSVGQGVDRTARFCEKNVDEPHDDNFVVTSCQSSCLGFTRLLKRALTGRSGYCLFCEYFQGNAPRPAIAYHHNLGQKFHRSAAKEKTLKSRLSGMQEGK